MADRNLLSNLIAKTSSIIFDEKLEMPDVPRLGQLWYKDGILYIYSLIDGIEIWSPLNVRNKTYVHTQVSGATTWTINHNLDDDEIIYSIYDQNNRLITSSDVTIAANTLTLNFLDAERGKCIIFAVGTTMAGAAADQNFTDLENDIIGVQDELDDTQAGAGLGVTGDYTADASTNYLKTTDFSTATLTGSLFNADKLLDIKVKALDDSFSSHDNTVHSTNYADELRNITAGTGLSGGGNLTADRTLTVDYGTTAGTACVGNDARLSDARTPLSHDNTVHSTNYADELRNITAGNGLTGGGDLTVDRTLTIGTPGNIGSGSTNNVTVDSHTHAASLNAADIPSLDASKITTGTLDLDRMPAGALDRLVIVTDETARFALTTGDVQNGDTVKQNDIEVMYRVVDDTNLNSAAGYVEYTAARATAVDWTGIENKPATFTPSSHDNTAHSTNYADELRTITSGTGLSGGGNLTADRTLTVDYGTAAGTACVGNDARLSDSREWTGVTISQAEAEAGTATTRRAWTAERVKQAIVSLGQSNIDIHEHSQSSASSTWTITHNLGIKVVQVIVTDTTDKVIIPDEITYTNTNSLTLSFNTEAITGNAKIIGI